jgi:hypothetical protein
MVGQPTARLSIKGEMVDYYQDTFGLRRLRLEERRCQEGPGNN